MLPGCIGVHSSSGGASWGRSRGTVAVSRVAAAGAMALTRTPYRASSASAMIEKVAMPVLAAP